jgi:hypothetical protein
MRNQFLSRCLFAVVLAIPCPVYASLPVPYAIVGCIDGSKFVTEGLAGPDLTSHAIKALKGKTVRLEGLLSPGDAFRAKALFVVLDTCRADLHRRYFLCAPCRTVEGHPPSTMLPHQGGTEVSLSPAAIKEFDNYPRSLRR